MPAFTGVSPLQAADQPAADSASVLVVDAQWPISANRLLLQADSPMPASAKLFDTSAIYCTAGNVIKGQTPLKLKHRKKRVPLQVPVAENGEVNLLLVQSYSPVGLGLYQLAYATPLKTCQRYLRISVEPGATYNIEMLFKGANCEVSVSNGKDGNVAVDYRQYKEAVCRDGLIRFY